jgi:hypothetical protein
MVSKKAFLFPRPTEISLPITVQRIIICSKATLCGSAGWTLTYALFFAKGQEGMVMVKKLGEILKEAGLIDSIQLEAALGRQKVWGGKLGHSLIELGFVNEEELAEAISKYIKIPYVNLFDPPLVRNQTSLLPPDLVRKYEVIPTSLRNNTLFLAMADPFDLETISELQFITSQKISPVLALESEIKDAIRKYYNGEIVDRKPTKKSNAGYLEIIHQRTMSDGQSEQHEKDLRIEALVDLLVEEGVISREKFAKMLLIKKAGA